MQRYHARRRMAQQQMERELEARLKQLRVLERDNESLRRRQDMLETMVAEVDRQLELMALAGTGGGVGATTPPSSMDWASAPPNAGNFPSAPTNDNALSDWDRLLRLSHPSGRIGALPTLRMLRVAEHIDAGRMTPAECRARWCGCVARLVPLLRAAGRACEAHVAAEADARRAEAEAAEEAALLAAGGGRRPSTRLLRHRSSVAGETAPGDGAGGGGGDGAAAAAADGEPASAASAATATAPSAAAAEAERQDLVAFGLDLSRARLNAAYASDAALVAAAKAARDRWAAVCAEERRAQGLEPLLDLGSDDGCDDDESTEARAAAAEAGLRLLTPEGERALAREIEAACEAAGQSGGGGGGGDAAPALFAAGGGGDRAALTATAASWLTAPPGVPQDSIMRPLIAVLLRHFSWLLCVFVRNHPTMVGFITVATDDGVQPIAPPHAAVWGRVAASLRFTAAQRAETAACYRLVSAARARVVREREAIREVLALGPDEDAAAAMAAAVAAAGVATPSSSLSGDDDDDDGAPAAKAGEGSGKGSGGGGGHNRDRDAIPEVVDHDPNHARRNHNAAATTATASATNTRASAATTTSARTLERQLAQEAALKRLSANVVREVLVRNSLGFYGIGVFTALQMAATVVATWPSFCVASHVMSQVEAAERRSSSAAAAVAGAAHHHYHGSGGGTAAAASAGPGLAAALLAAPDGGGAGGRRPRASAKARR